MDKTAEIHTNELVIISEKYLISDFPRKPIIAPINGRKIRKPISKAVFNSDVIKAGKTIDIGIDCLSSNGPASDKSANMFKVSLGLMVCK